MNAFYAMAFAREEHKGQVRKYTGDPYFVHLAEVAGLVATLGELTTDSMPQQARPNLDTMLAVAYLHDVIEDCKVTYPELVDRFGQTIADGVNTLSDTEPGNRETRVQLARTKMMMAPGWVQSIRCCDLISNTQSIVQHDPKFARVYLQEKAMLLEVMHRADQRIHSLAWNVLREGQRALVQLNLKAKEER